MKFSQKDTSPVCVKEMSAKAEAASPKPGREACRGYLPQATTDTQSTDHTTGNNRPTRAFALRLFLAVGSFSTDRPFTLAV